MRNLGRLTMILGLTLLGTALSASSASAAGINTATIRAHVLASYPDCRTCSLIHPHGCFVVFDTAEGPVSAHLPVQGGVTCSIDENACVEATGAVVDSLTTSVDVPNIQFEATIWSDVGSLCDD